MTISRQKILNVLSIFTLLFCSLLAHSQVLPSKEWRTVTIGEFELVFDAEHQPLAEIYAERLSKLTSTLRPYWKNIPRKTVVVLNDRTDLTNGFATFLPYPYVMIYPVLPGPMDSIGEYNDWAWEILLHEYTHILTFEQRRGVVYGLSWVFGNIITPNALLPTWWLEGLAVDSETRFSAGGRLRSKMQEASVRALVLTERFDKIRMGQINETDIPSWPYGGRPYLFGSLLWSEMINDTNDKVIGDLHDRTGGRAPYFLGTPLHELFNDKDQSDLWEQMRTSARTEAQKQLDILKKNPLTVGRVVDPEMVESLSPVLSPDGLKLAYVGKTDILRRRVQVLVRTKNDESFSHSMRIQYFGKDWDSNLSPSTLPRRDREDAPPGGNITRISWHPNSQQFVFDQVLEKNRFEELSDLWVFDLGKGKAEKITNDGRAREPAFSPNGEQIAYVQVEAGVTHLALWDVKTKEKKEIFHAPLQSRVSFPAWLDDDRIVFSVHENGHDKAFVKNLKTNDMSEILQNFKDPLYFDVQKDRILFTSTQNGVRNLYEATLDLKSIKAITNSPTHVFLATYDSGAKSYYYTELTDVGLTMKGVSETETNRANLTSIDPFWGSRYPEKPYEAPPKPEGGSRTEKAEPYSALGYLWPRYWLPFVGWDSQSTVVNVSTSGQDPLAKHSYFLSGSFDSSLPIPSALFSYINQSFWPAYVVSAYDITLRGVTNTSVSRNQLAQVGAAFEVASVSPDWFLNGGWSVLRRDRFGLQADLTGPYMGTTYSSVTMTPAQIAPESGWSGSLQLSRRYAKQLDRYNAVAEASGTYFWSRWLPRRNALMLRLNGRYSDELLQLQNLEQSLSLTGTTTSIASNYLMRGYPSGTFLGRNIVNPTIEYHFPISRLDVGPATVPFFLKRIHGAVVADGFFFDGYVYDLRTTTPALVPWDYGKGFWNAGLEARMEMNIGYHIPLSFIVGAYWPLTRDYSNSDPQLAFGFIL